MLHLVFRWYVDHFCENMFEIQINGLNECINYFQLFNLRNIFAVHIALDQSAQNDGEIE